RPQVSIDANFGIANAIRGYDDFLHTDALEYFKVIKASYENAGQDLPTGITALFGDPDNPSIPEYTYASGATLVDANGDGVGDTDAWGRPVVDESRYAYPSSLIMPGTAGTNWWDAVFGTGQVRDLNLAVRGGGENERYSVGFNYFDQYGTAEFNR